jgi:hypothetical protein
VNITFDLQELAQLLGKALGCALSAENICFTDDECITLTDVSIETLTKASQEIKTTLQPIKTPPPTVRFLSVTQEEAVTPPVEPADNFDDVMKISQQLAQTIPEESTEFPKEFMQGILSKIR